MFGRYRKYGRAASGIALLGAAVLLAACGSSGGGRTGGNGGNGGGSGGAAGGVPTAHLPVPKKIGKGEGQLNLIAWAGYLQPEWVKPFEQQTGCQVNAKYAKTSDEMVALMANGAGGQDAQVSSSSAAHLLSIFDC